MNPDTLYIFSIIITDLTGLKTVFLEFRPTGKHLWINVRDNGRGMRDQNFRRLAQVPSLPDALNFFFLSFTQARFAILLTRKIVCAGKFVYQIDILAHEIGLNFGVTQHHQSV